MGSRWKKSANARTFIKRQQNRIDFMEVIGTILGIIASILVILAIWKFVKLLLFSNFVT